MQTLFWGQPQPAYPAYSAYPPPIKNYKLAPYPAVMCAVTENPQHTCENSDQCRGWRYCSIYNSCYGEDKCQAVSPYYPSTPVTPPTPQK